MPASPILLSDRRVFPLLLNLMQLTGEGCEVGVFQAYYSDVILSQWTGKKLYAVDPYKSFTDEAYLDLSNLKQDEFETVFAQAKNRLSVYQDRASFIRKTSVDGAKDFADGSLDFVYLDGNHRYESVVEDIEAWYPKVKAGGILAGHDYVEDGISEHGDFGVQKAVAEYSKKYQINVYQTAEPFSSWMSQKSPAADSAGLRLDDLFRLLEDNNQFIKLRLSKVEREVQLLKSGNLRFLLRQPRKFFQLLLERSHEQEQPAAKK